MSARGIKHTDGTATNRGETTERSTAQITIDEGDQVIREDPSAAMKCKAREQMS